MHNSKYAKFKALDPFFDIVMKGLNGLVDGDYFWDAVADEAVFEFLYRFPGWPDRLEGRAAYMKVMEGYSMDLHSADGLVVHLTRDPRVVVLEYEVHGTAPSTGKPYDNRFCSIVTIADRKIVGSTRKFCLRGYFVEAPEARREGTRASLPALVNPC